MLFSWNVQTSDANNELSKNAIQYLSDPRLIKIKPNMVLVGVQYSITVTVTSQKDQSLFNTASVLINVKQQELIAIINQGEVVQTVSAETDVILTGERSHDPDTVKNNYEKNLMFLWKCTTLKLTEIHVNNKLIRINSNELIPGKVPMYANYCFW